MTMVCWPGDEERPEVDQPLDLVLLPVAKETNLTAMIRTMGQLNMGYGPWVAGGAARAVFEGVELRSPSDIDVFSPCLDSSKIVERSVRHVASVQKEATTMNETLTLLTKFSPPWQMQKTRNAKFQIIRSAYYTSLPLLFYSFDFTICQFATDGYNIVATRQAVEDCNSRLIRLTDMYPRKRVSTARLLKYINRGFSPAPGTLREVIQNTTNLDVSITPTGVFFVRHGY